MTNREEFPDLLGQVEIDRQDQRRAMYWKWAEDIAGGLCLVLIVLGAYFIAWVAQ